MLCYISDLKCKNTLVALANEVENLGHARFWVS